MPVVTHWNQEGYNQSREQRAAWYNSSENLTVLRKSSNSSAGAQLGETYRQDVGSQYTSKRKKNKLMINMHSELEEYNAVAIDGYKNIFIAKSHILHIHTYIQYLIN